MRIEVNTLSNNLKICEVKEYTIKRATDKIIPYSGLLTIFVLFHHNDETIERNLEQDLADRNIMFINDIAELDSYYNENVDIINNVDYLVVIVSESLLMDWDLMEILQGNYETNGENRKVIPIIIQEFLYEPKKKSAIIKQKQEEIKEYDDTYFDKNYNGEFAEELRRMQRILNITKEFLKFSINRDKKSSLSYAQRILRYLKHDRGIEMNMKINSKKENSQTQEPSAITNNFFGQVGNLQLQQGNSNNMKQGQNVVEEKFDYDQIKQIIDLINQEDNQLDVIYGDNVIQVRELVSEITSLTEQQKEPQKIKKALLTLKDLSVGITGSLIASGIVNMISSLAL